VKKLSRLLEPILSRTTFSAEGRYPGKPAPEERSRNQVDEGHWVDRGGNHQSKSIDKIDKLETTTVPANEVVLTFQSVFNINIGNVTFTI
jgi:hypothetical protein